VQSAKNVNLTGKTLDQRYAVQEHIGTGAHGDVYKAEDLSHKYRVALKVLASSMDTEKSRERWRHGAETAAHLAHPNIVRLYSFSVTADNIPYYVMDCVNGENLSDLLREKGSISEELCISIFSQVCDALQHAHAKGVVHRNLKPSNIMLIAGPNDSYMVKIADFGLAKARGEKETRQSLAKKGELLGNPNYMSPEQCTGGQIDERADIYAASCLLYECLTGQTPFAGSNSLEIMTQHTTGYSPELAAVAPALPHVGQLSTIVRRGMEKDPAKRYQAAGEMSHDLNLIKEAPEPEWNERAIATRPPVVMERKVTPVAPSFDVLKPLLIACAAILALVIISGASLAVIALTDADIKPLIRYKIAVQEIMFAPNDQRLIRNLNYMTDSLKAEGKYADAWTYKEKVLKAAKPPANIADRDQNPEMSRDSDH
jgi:eukaryotic-like serine/threonine-protein kinase